MNCTCSQEIEPQKLSCDPNFDGFNNDKIKKIVVTVPKGMSRPDVLQLVRDMLIEQPVVVIGPNHPRAMIVRPEDVSNLDKSVKLSPDLVVDEPIIYPEVGSRFIPNRRKKG